MPGRVVFEPEPGSECVRRGTCEDMPAARLYRDGTIWQCDTCGRRWVKWSGSQYNEHFDAWKLEG